MRPLDGLQKVSWKPVKPKLDENWMLTLQDEDLTWDLKAFCHKIHKEFFRPIEDVLMGTHVFLPNPLIKKMCDLMHVHAFQTLNNLSNYVE